MENENLQTKNLETLKAFAYDTLRSIEMYQLKLRQINEEIIKIEQQKKVEKSEKK